MNTLSDIGLIGLAVMGKNLVLNMESKGSRLPFLTGRCRRSIILLPEGQREKYNWGTLGGGTRQITQTPRESNDHDQSRQCRG